MHFKAYDCHNKLASTKGVPSQSSRDARAKWKFSFRWTIAATQPTHEVCNKCMVLGLPWSLPTEFSVHQVKWKFNAKPGNSKGKVFGSLIALVLFVLQPNDPSTRRTINAPEDECANQRVIIAINFLFGRFLLSVGACSDDLLLTWPAERNEVETETEISFRVITSSQVEARWFIATKFGESFFR